MNIKVCVICKTEKQNSEFNKNKCKKDGYQTLCKDCSKIKSKKYYNDNKEHHIKECNKRKKKTLDNSKQFIINYLKNNPCANCGESDILVLEFDHLANKSSNICNLVTSGCGLKRIKDEVAKCQVLCANCHRRKTAKDQNWYKYILGSKL